MTIASRIYLPEPGAASYRLDNLARSLVRRGSTVRTLTTTAPGHCPSPAPDGVTVSRWPALRDDDAYVRGYLQYLSYDVPLLLRLLLDPSRPEVVVCEPPPTTGAIVRAVCQARGIPYVYYAADVWAEALNLVATPRFVARALRYIERWAMQGSAGVISASEGVAAAARRLGVTAPIHVIGNGTDTDMFTPDGERAEDGDVFVYAGTASEVHGAMIFVDAFERVVAEHPQARLVFIGQGTDMPAIAERAAALPAGSMSILPRLGPAQTASWLRGARAALASVRPGAYGFAFPTKAFSAAACGTPVLMASAEPTRAPIAEHRLGWAVDFDVDAVADAMRDALARPVDDQTRDRLRRWALEEASLSATTGRGADIILDIADAAEERARAARAEETRTKMAAAATAAAAAQARREQSAPAKDDRTAR